MLEPGVNLSIMQAALVQRETRDDPGKYQTVITQERKDENAKKPKNPSAANIAKEVAKEVAAKVHGTETAEGASALFTAPRHRDSGNNRGCGRVHGNASSRGSSARGKGRDGGSTPKERKLVTQRQTREVLAEARGTAESWRKTSRQGKCAAISPCERGTVRQAGERISRQRCVATNHHRLRGCGVTRLCPTD
jgi:hypothetical protein